MFRGSSAVITISQSMVEHARSIGAINPRLVPTPVAHSFVHQPVSTIPAKIQRVLFVGRLAAEKNIGHFLALAEHRPDLFFEIVGDGPLRSLVRQTADELPNLLFTGWLSRDQVLHHLNASDLLILPSSVEAFGTVSDASVHGKAVTNPYPPLRTPSVTVRFSDTDDAPAGTTVAVAVPPVPLTTAVVAVETVVALAFVDQLIQTVCPVMSLAVVPSTNESANVFSLARYIRICGAVSARLLMVSG
jgi:glycosyltransferase involved in cell wall biosynthesis